MKKISLILSVLLLVMTVSSCAAEAPELKDFIGNVDSSYADLGGRTVFIGVTDIVSTDSLVPLPEDTSAKSDAQRALIKSVEEKLHCVISETVIDEDTIPANIIGQNCKSDLLYNSTQLQSDWIKSGLLYDLNTFDNLDLSNESKWGTAREQLHRTYQGKVFGVKPMGADSSYTSLEGVMMVNEALIKTFAQPTPKELLEQGNWTFDYFTDYVVKVSDMNAETQIYGMTYYDGQLHQLPLTAIFSNGSSLLNVSDSGEFSFDLSSDPKVNNALNWAKEVYATGVIAEDDFDDTHAGYFIEGRSSLWLGGAWVGTTNRPNYPLNKMKDGFSFINVPYGPDAVYGETYSSFIFVSRSLAVPISSDAYEMGCFLNEFCTEFSEDDLEAMRYETQSEYFFNEEDYDFLLDMADNAVYTYLYVELSDVRESILKALETITMGNGSISESIGSIQSLVDAELENIKQ